MFWPHDFAITLSDLFGLRMPAALRSEWLSLPFWPFLAWTGIFVGSQPSSLQVLLLRFHGVTPAHARNTSFVSLFHSQMCVCVCVSAEVCHVMSRHACFPLLSPIHRCQGLYMFAVAAFELNFYVKYAACQSDLCQDLPHQDEL